MRRHHTSHNSSTRYEQITGIPAVLLGHTTTPLSLVSCLSVFWSSYRASWDSKAHLGRVKCRNSRLELGVPVPCVSTSRLLISLSRTRRISIHSPQKYIFSPHHHPFSSRQYRQEHFVDALLTWITHIYEGPCEICSVKGCESRQFFNETMG